jgi:hypothetical protein
MYTASEVVNPSAYAAYGDIAWEFLSGSLEKQEKKSHLRMRETHFFKGEECSKR